jgi:hypothetical protein
MVRANTRPVTVIMVDDTTISSERASSAVPWKAKRASGESSSTSTRDKAAPAQQEHHHRERGEDPEGAGQIVPDDPAPADQLHLGVGPFGLVATNSS